MSAVVTELRVWFMWNTYSRSAALLGVTFSVPPVPSLAKTRGSLWGYFFPSFCSLDSLNLISECVFGVSPWPLIHCLKKSFACCICHGPKLEMFLLQAGCVVLASKALPYTHGRCIY